MAGSDPDPGGGECGERGTPQRSLLRTVMAMAPWRLLNRVDRADSHFDAVEIRLDSAERSLGLVDARVDALEIRLDSVEGALGRIDQRVGAAEVENDARASAAENRLDQVEGRVDGLGSEVGGAASRLDQVEKTQRKLQAVVEGLASVRVAAVEDRVDLFEKGLGRTDDEVERLRDGTIPAAVRRADVLLERLNSELEETASLVERMLLSEPLPIVAPSLSEESIARSLAHLHPALLDSLRGSEEEIVHRLEANLPLVRDSAPVLDLGCGRGELLTLLREAGVEAVGVEGDPALADGARRRGLSVREGDVLEVLRSLEDETFGAITAIHLLEHLSLPTIVEVLTETRRVLRPGGALVFECPNPHSLRVGGALFWLDPTHVRPLLPETLQLLLRASGYEVTTVEYRHPFPDDQLLTDGEGTAEDRKLGARIAEIERRFDAIVNGPRDFMVSARKPIT